MNYPPPQRRRRPVWQWGCGALLLLVVCGGIAAVVSPKAPAAPTVPAANVPTAASVPTPTAQVAQAAPTAAPSPTVDYVATLSATSTALAGLPPNVRYAPAGCTSGVRYGAMCKDGSYSGNPGQGSCSGHKGVQEWLACP